MWCPLVPFFSPVCLLVCSALLSSSLLRSTGSGRDNTDVVFLQVDVDACGDVAEDCDVNAMPTFHFYKNGDKVDMFEGASEQKLSSCIAKHR